MNQLLDSLYQLDLSLFHFINTEMSNSFFNWFMPLITDLHKNTFIIFPASGFLFWLLWRMYGTQAIRIFLGLIFTLAFCDWTSSSLIKNNVQRLRPGDQSSISAIVRSPYGGYSFVSNHSANMFAFAIFAGFFLKRLRASFILLASIIAFSRVYNGVHFPSDVFFGGLYGSGLAFIFHKTYSRFLMQEKA